MKKQTFERFKDFPLIGDAVKVAYFGGLVKNIVKDRQDKEAKSEMVNLTGDELENAIRNEANVLFDENITPEITAYQIPGPIVSRIKARAISKLTNVLKQKAIEAAQKKI
jgi:hypothetical protein